MRRVVISQSMYFPWVGMLEQIRLADAFIHYDDVQFSKGSFSNRVQVKLPGGMSWMTVPLRDHRLGQTIDEVRLQPTEAWRGRHLALLEQSFDGAPHAADALDLAASVIGGNHDTLADLARSSMLALCRYFGLYAQGPVFRYARDCRHSPGSGSRPRYGWRCRRRTVECARRTYITGHRGASR